METDKIFIDRFNDYSYTLSKFDGTNYVKDIAVVNNYKVENPNIIFTQTTDLKNLKHIIDVVEEQKENTHHLKDIQIELTTG